VDHADADSTLLEKIRNDEPDAFDQLVARYGDRIYAYGMRMCGDREDASDVFQETLLQAFRSLKGLKEPKALRSWLYRVVSNACLMKRRKGKFEPRRELSLEQLMPESAEQAAIEIPDLSTLPEDAVVRREAQRAVREAIDTLPASYREVLVLRDLEQLSTRETARALDLPESTIKMRLHRARLMVRNELADRVGNDAAEASG
jgi:RNA polymerase sigma-70 factor (ECF subfamily)